MFRVELPQDTFTPPFFVATFSNNKTFSLLTQRSNTTDFPSTNTTILYNKVRLSIRLSMNIPELTSECRLKYKEVDLTQPN